MTVKGDPDWLWEFRAEDFVHARLREELAEAQNLPADQRETATDRLESLRLATVEHSPFVDGEGQSWGRCVTCPPHNGFPCSTMRYLTRMWRGHPDYQPAWNDTLDRPGGPSEHQRQQKRLAELGGYRREFLAEHPEAIE